MYFQMLLVWHLRELKLPKYLTTGQIIAMQQGRKTIGIQKGYGFEEVCILSA